MCSWFTVTSGSRVLERASSIEQVDCELVDFSNGEPVKFEPHARLNCQVCAIPRFVCTLNTFGGIKQSLSNGANLESAGGGPHQRCPRAGPETNQFGLKFFDLNGLLEFGLRWIVGHIVNLIAKIPESC